MEFDPILRPFPELNNFGEQIMQRNDDGSSSVVTLPFPVNFYGQVYNELFINNNGNISFNSSLGSYTPEQFPIASQPIIAPYWADVDTRNEESGLVYLGFPNEDTVVVTWDNVGYFSSNVDLTNTFQLVLRDRSENTGITGDFDIEFRYGQLEWTTGDASDGEGGLGGTPAQAGFDAGNLEDFFILPGSFTEDVLDLVNTSNVSERTPGLWSFSIRSGVTPGQAPSNPLLPVVTDSGFNFEYFIQNPVEFVFFDPIIAIGYDYIVNSGPNFSQVQVPMEVAGDDGVYDILLPDGNGNLVETDFAIQPNQIFDFTQNGFPDGVASFGIRGIDENALLDPEDANAFVTGLQFTASGLVDFNQNPVTIEFNIPPSALNLTNTVTTLAENTATNIRVADIAVVDDGLGVNTLSLSGADASSFEIRGNQLFLIAPSLDFEAKNAYSVTVNVDDTTVGQTPDLSTNFSLSISDVNETPSPLPITLSPSGSAGDDDLDAAFGDNGFMGENQLLFTGSGMDMIDVSQAGSNSRIDTGSGDDTLFAGTNNRIILGDGDDKLFISTSGGGNRVTGGEGAEQFWVFTDEGAIPNNPNIISDFTSGEDVIGFLNTTLSLGSGDFSYEQMGSDVIISAFGQEIAKLLNATAVDTDFVFA
ncbi:MAG: hypothetical protein IGQ45_10465 [Cyanobacterium sp. T60_A2020_053]|nr:hypothetical protein [Cyanobacterium sp. T60_A2020_053]